MKNKLYIIGSGGHCRPVSECAINSGYSIQYIIDLNKKVFKKNEKIFGITIKPYNEIKNIHKGSQVFLAIGDNKIRKRLFEMYENEFNFVNLIHSSAFISKSAKIGIGNFIGPKVIINSKVVILDNCIINTGSILEHEVELKNNIHVAPGSIICGRTKVYSNTLIGTGSIILDYLQIKENTTIGAGAVVRKNTLKNSTYVGIPAKKIKK